MARGRVGKDLGVGSGGESIDEVEFEELSEGGELSAGVYWSDISKSRSSMGKREGLAVVEVD